MANQKSTHQKNTKDKRNAQGDSTTAQVTYIARAALAGPAPPPCPRASPTTSCSSNSWKIVSNKKRASRREPDAALPSPRSSLSTSRSSNSWKIVNNKKKAVRQQPPKRPGHEWEGLPCKPPRRQHLWKKKFMDSKPVQCQVKFWEDFMENGVKYLHQYIHKCKWCDVYACNECKEELDRRN